jgi:hypothetical protein
MSVVVHQEEKERPTNNIMRVIKVISWRMGLLWLTNKTTNEVLIKMEHGY